MDQIEKAKKIEALKAGIRKYTPVVAEFFDRTETIREYSEKIYQFQIDPVHQKRQEGLVPEMEKFISRLFNIETKIKTPLATNIVDHHSICNHPIFIATNIVANAFRLIGTEQGTPDPIIALTSSIVPPNNFFNRKGFQFHGQKIPLFSNSEMHQAGCFIKLHDFRFVSRLRAIDRWKQFNKDEQEFLRDIEGEMQQLDFSRARSYNDQIGIINAFLWKKLFSSDLREKIPDLLYVPQEDLLWAVFPKILEQPNLISRSLFDADFQRLVLERFNGIIGCWDQGNNKGTHFFWYRDDQGEAKRLFLKGGQLNSEDGSKAIDVNTDTIVDLLTKNEIIPGLFMIFGFLTFWCGVKPLVGHGSCNYLTKMKEAWLDVLQTADQEEYQRVQRIDTKGLIGGAMVTFGRTSQQEIATEYAFDVISRGGLSEQYLAHLLSMRLNDVLQPALLEIYNSYVPVAERVDLGLEPKDMMGASYDWV